MKERQILFKGPLVRAILAGQKTVTRRVIKQAAGASLSVEMLESGQALLSWLVGHGPGYEVGEQLKFVDCPYGVVGDRLWVRETWYCDHFEVMRGPYLKPDDLDVGEAIEDGTLVYAADGLTPYEADQPIWKPSIHMPRWASRILLEITDVRLERLQDITEEQARAEGITDGGCTNCGNNEPCGCDCPAPSAIDSFCHLWGEINGPHAWDANPWVWVVEFKQVTPP